ncbi:MAG: tetratricopeptide repeat protein [Thermodesulfovibrionales bacterium]
MNLVKKNFKVLLILFAPILIYWQALSGDFVLDDRTYFIENDILPALKPWQLSHIFFKPSNLWGEHLPLRDFFYVIEYNLFGLSPYGYHVVSLGLYILTGYILYLFLSEVYSDTVYSQLKNHNPVFYKAEISVFVVTILYLVHPSHVETVAYISGQKDLLVALFSFLTMFLFYKYFNSRAGKGRLLSLGILTYYLAFFSKLAAVSLILMIPVLWNISSEEHRLKSKRFFAVWIIINLPVVIWILIYKNILSSYNNMFLLEDIDILGRIIRAVKMFGFYATHALKPLPLSFGYPFDDVSVDLDKFFWAGIAVEVIFLSLLILQRKKIIFFASAIFFIFLIPVMQLFGRLNNASLYDRYLSISLLGLCILFERALAVMFVNAKWLRFFALSIFLSVVIALSILTLLYVPAFQSDIESTRNSYEKFPDWPTSSFNYTYSLIEGGKLDKAWDMVVNEESFSSPLWVREYFKGWIYLQRGEFGQSVSTLAYPAMLASGEGYFPFPSIPLGKALIALGRYEEAKQEFQRALSSKIYQPLEMYKSRKELEKIARIKSKEQ